LLEARSLLRDVESLVEESFVSVQIDQVTEGSDTEEMRLTVPVERDRFWSDFDDSDVEPAQSLDLRQLLWLLVTPFPEFAEAGLNGEVIVGGGAGQRKYLTKALQQRSGRLSCSRL
jgi:hypothetical protein